MGDGLATFYRNGRRDRGRLNIGTALGGAAALLLVPSVAHAATPSSPYRLTAPTFTLMQAGETGSSLARLQLGAFEAAPQDLTVHAAPLNLANHAMARNALPRAMATGVGDVTYSGGDITTTGDYMPGISTNSPGATTITANSVTTNGYFSPGVYALGIGAIDVKVGTVSTSGDLSTGIFAYSANGNVSVESGSVYTTGRLSRGIEAVGSNVTVTAGSVTTTGLVSDGVLALGYGPDANVDVTINGSVTTAGTLSLGVSGYSTGSLAIHDNGSVTTFGQGRVAFLQGQAIGILAYAAGDVTVDGGGSVATYGPSSKGVWALSKHGDISIDLGSVTTSGGTSEGILAEAAGYDPYTQQTVGTGNVAVTVGRVQTNGKYSNAIVAIGRSDDITVNGSVATNGPASYGVIAASYGGDISIHNNGVIATYGPTSTAIIAQAQGDITIDGDGRISANGGRSFGIEAVSIGGSIAISQGDVSSGFRGVYARALPSQGLGDPANSISISVGNVSTSEAGVIAQNGPLDQGILAINSNYQGAISINAASVKTRGDYGTGIGAYANYGAVSVTAGSVATHGFAAHGIVAEGGSADVTVGSAGTEGDRAVGVAAIAMDPVNGHSTINVGTVTTTGEGAAGIYGVGGGVTINAGTVTTTGDGSNGIVAEGFNSVSISESQALSTQGSKALGILARTGLYGTIDLALDGKISTTGGEAAGVVAVGGFGAINVKANSITTAGGGAPALVVYSFYGTPTVTLGSASTSGIKSPTVMVVGGAGLNVTAGTIASSGDDSNALILRSGSYGVGGTGVANIDTITTTGTHSAGIDAFAAGDASHVSTLALNVNSITTSGIDSPGISAIADYGALNINAGSIKTSGYESTGVLALGGSDIGIQVGSVDTAATSIYANGSGTGAINVGVTGKLASSGSTGIIAINAGGATNVTVGSGGSVSGADEGIRVESGTGQVSITNAGTISGGSGYAIDVSGLPASMLAMAKLSQASVAVATPGTLIANSGTITGAVSLADGDDVLTNSGTFVATKDSDFGAGNDLFVNTGKLVVQPGTKPGNVTLLGLETFQNSGLIDLRNGVAGDTLTLPGNYIASGKAALGVDLGANGITDKLIVNGTVTGTTSILINATAGNATLLSTPITLIQAGGSVPAGVGGTGMAANAFSIANQSVGFVTYGLSFNAATNSFQLSAQAGSPVYRFTKLSEAAQAIGRQSGEAWRSHMAELRDMDEPARRVWGQAYGQVDSRDETRSVAVAGAPSQSYDLGYRQDYYGAQAGVDLAGKRADNGNGLLFGVTGGYLSSHMNFRAGADRVRFDTVNVGGYAGVRAGPLFANLLGQYAHYRTTAFNGVEQWSDKFSGNGYGVEGEVGARLGSDTLFAEPVASLAWQKTDLGTLHALGQSLAFDHDSGLTGSFGARFGGSVAMAGGGKAVFYAKASYVHAFSGKGGLLFTSGGTSEDVAGTKLGNYGQAAVGVDFITAGRVSGFIEGDADVGGSTHGGGGRVGIRFKL